MAQQVSKCGCCLFWFFLFVISNNTEGHGKGKEGKERRNGSGSWVCYFLVESPFLDPRSGGAGSSL